MAESLFAHRRQTRQDAHAQACVLLTAGGALRRDSQMKIRLPMSIGPTRSDGCWSAAAWNGRKRKFERRGSQ